MYFRYSIIVLIVLCTLVSALGLDFILHKKYLFWKVSFYFTTYLFIVTIVKCFLGHKKENIIESFWGMSTATLIHYGVPMLVMSVALPIILKLVFGGGYRGHTLF